MSKPIIFNEMESVEIAANLARDAETGGDRQGLEDVDINIDPVDDVATATSNKTSSTSSKVKGLFYLGGVACGAAAGFAYGGVETNKAGAVQSQMAGAVKTTKAPRATGAPKTTKAPKSVCPVSDSGSGGNNKNKCPSDERKAALESKFGIPINDYAVDGYNKLENTFVQGEGFAVAAATPGGNTVTIEALEDFSKVVGSITGYKFPISEFECIEEVYALGANACDGNPDCTYFSVKEDYGEKGNFVSLLFWSQESVTAQTTYDGSILGASEGTGFPGSRTLRNSQIFTTFIKYGETPPPNFDKYVCDVPPVTQTRLTFTCSFLQSNPALQFATFLNGCCGDNPPASAATCQASFVNKYNAGAGNTTFTRDNYCDCPNLPTADFGQYVALPAVNCLDNDPDADFQKCLGCVSKFTEKFDCNSGPEVCEEDNAKNFITAMPCDEGEVQTDGCVCDACGKVCGTQCKAEIQTSISCLLGSTFAVVENEKGAFVESGSCLNSQIVSGSRDFSCPSS